MQARHSWTIHSHHDGSVWRHHAQLRCATSTAKHWRGAATTPQGVATCGDHRPDNLSATVASSAMKALEGCTALEGWAHEPPYTCKPRMGAVRMPNHVEPVWAPFIWSASRYGFSVLQPQVPVLFTLHGYDPTVPTSFHSTAKWCIKHKPQGS